MGVREYRRSRRHRGGRFLTPLIDIIFLLSLFFVLNTSFRQERYMDVNLPSSQSSEDIQAIGMVLTLREDGSTTLEGSDIPWESLTDSMRELAREKGIVDVIIRADKSISYARMVEALDRVREAGLDSISLQTLRAGK